MSREYILRWLGEGDLPEADYQEISNRVEVLDKTSVMMLVKTTEDELRDLLTDKPNWIWNPNQTIKLHPPGTGIDLSKPKSMGKPKRTPKMQGAFDRLKCENLGDCELDPETDELVNRHIEQAKLELLAKRLNLRVGATYEARGVGAKTGPTIEITGIKATFKSTMGEAVVFIGKDLWGTEWLYNSAGKALVPRKSFIYDDQSADLVKELK